jgi:hypothetical protein
MIGLGNVFKSSATQSEKYRIFLSDQPEDWSEENLGYNQNQANCPSPSKCKLA